MTSPVIDENVMIEALQLTQPQPLSEQAKRLRTGAALLMLDAYDRKLTRDQFIAALGAAVDLVDMLGRYEAFNNVKAFEIEKGCVTKADLEVALATSTDKIAVCSEQCAKMARLIHQCSLNEDKVH